MGWCISSSKISYCTLIHIRSVCTGIDAQIHQKSGSDPDAELCAVAHLGEGWGSWSKNESKKVNDSNPPSPLKKHLGYVPGDVLIKIDFQDETSYSPLKFLIKFYLLC